LGLPFLSSTGLVNGCARSEDPTSRPFRLISEPSAFEGNATWLMPVTMSG